MTTLSLSEQLSADREVGEHYQELVNRKHLFCKRAIYTTHLKGKLKTHVAARQWSFRIEEYMRSNEETLLPLCLWAKSRKPSRWFWQKEKLQWKRNKRNEQVNVIALLVKLKISSRPSYRITSVFPHLSELFPFLPGCDLSTRNSMLLFTYTDGWRNTCYFWSDMYIFVFYMGIF